MLTEKENALLTTPLASLVKNPQLMLELFQADSKRVTEIDAENALYKADKPKVSVLEGGKVFLHGTTSKV